MAAETKRFLGKVPFITSFLPLVVFNLVLSMGDGQCTVRDGEASAPALTVISPADVGLKMARGELNPAKALMDGLYKAEGDMNLLVKLSELFQPPVKAGTEVR